MALFCEFRSVSLAATLHVHPPETAHCTIFFAGRIGWVVPCPSVCTSTTTSPITNTKIDKPSTTCLSRSEVIATLLD